MFLSILAGMSFGSLAGKAQEKGIGDVADDFELINVMTGDPVRLSDFFKKELQYLRLGRYQFTPFGDCTGRRVVAIFLDKEWEAVPSRIKVSIFINGQ